MVLSCLIEVFILGVQLRVLNIVFLRDRILKSTTYILLDFLNGEKSSLPPGFRFHPTDVELCWWKKLHLQAIAIVEIYKYAPWDLPDKSRLRTGDLKWYFFCPTGKKYASGVRMKRATDTGYWKTTGKDKSVQYKNEAVGMIKTLVFHTGRAPKGERTDWVIYKYRLEEMELADKGIAQDGYVLCVIFKKGTGPKNGSQYGAPFEEGWNDDDEVEEVNFQKAILPAAVHTPAFMLPKNSNMSIAMNSYVPESTCTGPPVLCPSQTPTAGTTLPMVSNNDVASTEDPHAVHEFANGSEADFSAGISAKAFQKPSNPNGSILASSSSFVPENMCYPAYIPSMDASQMEAPRIMDDNDGLPSLLAILDNNSENVDFVGIAESEPGIYRNLGDIATSGTGDNISNTQYFMDPPLLDSNVGFLELVGLDTPHSIIVNKWSAVATA
ncbi:hypothetical protein SADUNF_Sadunf05G0035900 [Salix dunnii]|uniref:NAC domain-containing protein n=1 Tax=Salix dunnii TaxID=1413687 RepID=A0A835N1P7_9ROSI|nr:hypothetical protein SADUNF_Sadunf05G0035900 [Salix dunnii]